MLCPQPGGPLRRIASGNAWVHVACAIWTPEVEIQDVDKLSGIDVRRVPSARWNDVGVRARFSNFVWQLKTRAPSLTL